MKPLRIGVLGYEGVQGLDVVGPSDAFSIAGLEDESGTSRPRYEIILLSANNKPFRAESGLLFHPQRTLKNAPDLDTLIIPGGKGTRDARVSEPLTRWIASRAGGIRRIASVCTGIYIL